MDDANKIRLAAADRRRRCEIAVIAVAALIAAASARDYAGGWNDGSRLATVESLIDRHTLAIDDSIFVRSPAAADAPNPYDPNNELLRAKGTQDKLLIAGHYYSDKSPLPAFWLAAWYQLLQWLTGLTARDHPRLFCYGMTVVSSGVAYVLTAWSVWRLALRKELPLATCLLLAGSISLATIALPYTRHVNNHVLLLALVALLMLALDQIGVRRQGSGIRSVVAVPVLARSAPVLAGSPDPASGGDRRSLLLLSAAAGTLAGLGYTIDLGLGPVLLLGTALIVAYRTRSVVAIVCFSVAAAPWPVAHHVVNYLTGGTLGPANSVAEYLAWPGSPFSPKNMTGGWAHHDLGHFFLYAAALLFGKHGFLNYNLPLFALIFCPALAFRRRLAEFPEIVFAATFSGAAWLLYAALSNNYSGPCCSIRWFVPLLAPAYYLLVIILRERPALVRQLAILSACGLVLNISLWWRGPWDGTVPLLLWPLNITGLVLLALSGKASRHLPSQQGEVATRRAA